MPFFMPEFKTKLILCGKIVELLSRVDNKVVLNLMKRITKAPLGHLPLRVLHFYDTKVDTLRSGC